MLKQFLAAILLLAFAVSNFCSVFIVFDYYNRPAAYAANCENKARPKLHCNGKCQMMKKLQQQENSSQNNSEKKANSKIQVISSKSFFTSLFITDPNGQVLFWLPAAAGPVDRSYSLFRPPSNV